MQTFLPYPDFAATADPALHRSHRAALTRKDPRHYRRHFGDLPYVWPVSGRRAQ
ncbi:MAG: hypothetical protein ACRDUA_13075 [Micromonosporaceae bacterium]